MKQHYIKTIVSSALLVFSNLASANSINFKNAADAIIDSELPALYASYQDSYQSYLDGGGYSSIEKFIWDNQSIYYEQDPYNLKRAVNLSELSNSDVMFSNTTNLGVYKDTIIPGTDSYKRDNISGIGGMSFTASFSQPVTNVRLDFYISNYLINPNETNDTYGATSGTPVSLNAIYKDALGNIIGSTSEITSFNFYYQYGQYWTHQPNNSGFSIGSSNPFSSIDITADAGTIDTVIRAPDFSCDGWSYRCFSPITYPNLIIADNFSYTLAAVPEPDTYVMLLVGLGLVGFATKRKKRLSDLV